MYLKTTSREHKSLAFDILELFTLKAGITQDSFWEAVYHSPFTQSFFSDLGLQLSSKKLWAQAISHSSFINEYKNLSLYSYERLEFLGDSVLELIISEELEKNFPNKTEGELSKSRTLLVNTNSLASLAKKGNINSLILLGKGELSREAMNLDSLLADVFEAILGAFFKEGGPSFAKIFFFAYLEKFDPHFLSIKDTYAVFDPKSALQEKTYALYGVPPEYHSFDLEKGDFAVQIFIDGQFLGEKIGPAKKKVQQELAREILDKKKYLNLNN